MYARPESFDIGMQNTCMKKVNSLVLHYAHASRSRDEAQTVQANVEHE